MDLEHYERSSIQVWLNKVTNAAVLRMQFTTPRFNSIIISIFGKTSTSSPVLLTESRLVSCIDIRT